MDRREEAAYLLVKLNELSDGEITPDIAIKAVCQYFDKTKHLKQSEADKNFLKYAANAVGIPHYYDLLERFGIKTELEEISLNAFSALFYESSLHVDEQIMLHRYQKEILNRFELEKRNRFFLSASTSFGKTFLVYEVIKKMGYKNVVLIFPAIALLSENLERIYSDPSYAYFKDNYKIHTLSEPSEIGEQNIFIYTPERFLSFTERNTGIKSFDFVFIDEFYKIDNDLIIDEVSIENERDISYRIASFYALLNQPDALLAGPYIEATSPSFNRFLDSYGFQVLDYNKIEIVDKSYHKAKKNLPIDDLNIKIQDEGKQTRLIEIARGIKEARENAIIYCSSQSDTEKYAKWLFNADLGTHTFDDFGDFLINIENHYNAEWIVPKALKQGIGIHHASIPKYIQKEIVSLFNTGKILFLLSTTTITEGVNTSAKNLIITNATKGGKPLKRFDAKNIAGRAGRFFQHYKGRVIMLDKKFEEALEHGETSIRHKGFDVDADKDDIDLPYITDGYLRDDQLQRKREMDALQAERKIPLEVLQRYKAVSHADKIHVYDAIKSFSETDKYHVHNLVTKLQYGWAIDWDGMQVIWRSVRPIVKNAQVQGLIDRTCLGGTSDKSLLTQFVSRFLVGGFQDLLQYYLGQDSVDNAMRTTARLVFNTMKYQVVKYLGVFNLMYKYSLVQEKGGWIDEMPGLDRMLSQLEYSAVTEQGKLVSDYGVPPKVLDYFEASINKSFIKDNFDDYERSVFNKIERLLVEREKV